MPTIEISNNSGTSGYAKLLFNYSYTEGNSYITLNGIKLQYHENWWFPWYPCRTNSDNGRQTFIKINNYEIKGTIYGTATYYWGDSSSYLAAQGGGGGSTTDVQGVRIALIDGNLNFNITCYLYSTTSGASNNTYFNNVTHTENITSGGGTYTQQTGSHHNVGDKIEASYLNFDKLRQEVLHLINSRGRTTRANDNDKSTFQSYDWSGGADTPLGQEIESTSSNPNFITQQGNEGSGKQCARAAAIIHNLIKNNYMKKPSSTNEKTAWENINNQPQPNQNVIIPALKNYFTIVNYWNTGTDTGALNNNNGSLCNGACTGFCVGSCFQQATGGTGCNGNSCSSGSDSYVGTNYCASCSTHCVSSCSDCVSGCFDGCESYCGSGCSGGCNNSGCTGNCSSCTGTCSSSEFVNPIDTI